MTTTSSTPEPKTPSPVITALSNCSYSHCIQEYTASCNANGTSLEEIGDFFLDCFLFPVRLCAEVLCAILDGARALFNTIVNGFQTLTNFAIDIGQILANIDVDRRQMAANRLFNLSRPLIVQVDEIIDRLSDLPRSQRIVVTQLLRTCLLYTSPSPRDATLSRMPSSA